MPRFNRGDLVVVMRTDQGHCGAKGRVIDYDSEAHRYCVELTLPREGEVIYIRSQDLVLANENQQKHADLSHGEPFEAFDGEQ